LLKNAQTCPGRPRAAPASLISLRSAMASPGWCRVSSSLSLAYRLDPICGHNGLTATQGCTTFFQSKSACLVRYESAPRGDRIGEGHGTARRVKDVVPDQRAAVLRLRRRREHDHDRGALDVLRAERARAALTYPCAPWRRRTGPACRHRTASQGSTRFTLHELEPALVECATSPRAPAPEAREASEES
jgi:hypothetical protein